MKRILGLFLGLCFFIFSGCSSVTVPEGVDADFYKKWEVFYREPIYNRKFVYDNDINNKENLVDFDRKDLISEIDLVQFYGNSYEEINKIVKSKTDYMTNVELFKNNLKQLEKIDSNLNRVFILSYSNANKWDFDKVKLDYYSDLIYDIKEKNIRYLLDKEEYLVNIRFENISTFISEKNELMTNGFGATINVEKETFYGYYLKAVPRKIEIPLEVSKAKSYDIDNLEVLLYVILNRIDEKKEEIRPTLSLPIYRLDFRRVFEVQVLGYQLRDKKSKETIAQGIL